MNSKIARLIPTLTRPFNLSRMISRSGQHSIVPFYHTVSDEELVHIKHLYRYKRIGEFEKDLDDFLTYYEPVGLKDFLDARLEPHDRRNMLLTFDDGLIECYEVIAPILKKKGVPAVFFLNNHFLDNQDLFYRYKVSILVERLESSKEWNSIAASFLKVPEDQVKQYILELKYAHLFLIDELAYHLELDFSQYLHRNPIYMSRSQVKDLISWGFDIGGHSLDHPRYEEITEEEVLRQTRESLQGLRDTFETSVDAFAFPFSSFDIPSALMAVLMRFANPTLLMGTEGLRESRNPFLVQRIDMEQYPLRARDVLTIKYLIYLIRKPMNKHLYRY